MVEVLDPLLAVIVVGAALTVDCDAEGPPLVTVTAAVCVIATIGPAPTWAVAEMVFASALLELKVPVVTPAELVLPGCTKLLLEPLEDSTTAAPWIGLPKASRTVTVTVEAVPPPVVQPALHAAMVPGAAPTDDCEFDTAAGFTVTLAVWVMETMGPAPT